MQLPYPHRRLSITFAARALSLSAPDRSRSADGREAWAIAAKISAARRATGALIRASDSFSGCPLHGSVKSSAEPLVSGWRSLVIERVIGRSDAQSPKRCSCDWGSCFAKAPAGKLSPRSSTAGPTRAAVDTPSCVDLGVNMYLFRARPRTAHDTDVPLSPFNSAAAIGWIILI